MIPSVNDEVKSELLKSIGSWIKACSSVAEPVFRTLNAALNGKESLRNAALSALAACHDNASLFSGVQKRNILDLFHLCLLGCFAGAIVVQSSREWFDKDSITARRNCRSFVSVFDFCTRPQLRYLRKSFFLVRFLL